MTGSDFFVPVLWGALPDAWPYFRRVVLALGMDEAPFWRLLYQYGDWHLATASDLVRFLQGPLRPRLLAHRSAGAARDPLLIAREPPPADTLTALTGREYQYLPWWIQEVVLEDTRTGAPHTARHPCCGRTGASSTWGCRRRPPLRRSCHRRVGTARRVRGLG